MTTITRKQGSHHKVRELPVGELVTIGVLFLLCVAILAGLFAVTSTQASAATVSYLRPAVTAAHAFKPRTWQQVLTHCRKAKDCHKVPAAIRRDLGIRPGQPARVEYGDTTYIWAKQGRNGVRTYNS